jgi:hypothetical protein
MVPSYILNGPDENHNIEVSNPCLRTGKTYAVTVRYVDFLQFLYHGKHAQDAFPYLSLDDREFLISGYSPEGWDLAMGVEIDD